MWSFVGENCWFYPIFYKNCNIWRHYETQHEIDIWQTFKYHFWIHHEISYKIGTFIFFYKIIYGDKNYNSKKSSRFWDFPYMFLNKSGLTGPISRNLLWCPHPTHQNVQNMFFLYPHGALEVTIIVIVCASPKILMQIKL